MNIVLNLLVKDSSADAPWGAALTQFLEAQGFKLSVMTLPDTMLITGSYEQAEQQPQEAPQEAPAEVTAVELPPVEEPVDAVAAEPAPAMPELKLSFEQVVIANLDAAVSVPASFDPEREHSVLVITSGLTEDTEAHHLKFNYGQSEYSVPVFDGMSGIVENAGDLPRTNTFRALIKLSPDQPLRGVCLGIEVVEGASTEQVIFGKDMAALITSHEEPSDAVIP